MNNKKIDNRSPSWWQHSNNSWLQLLDALAKINPLELSNQQIQSVYLEENWRLITTGKTNFNYQLQLESLKLFVQIINKNHINKLPDSKFIKINHLIQSQTEISNHLAYCYYESENLRVFEWIQDPQLLNNLFDDQLLINQFCDFLIKLHKIKIVELPKIDIKIYLKKYYEMALKNSLEKVHEIDNLFNNAKNCFKYFQASSLCHHDLSIHNIFLKDNIKIIDWEYAAISDPFMDLAGVTNNFQLTEEQETRFLTAYFNQSDSIFNQEKYDSLKVLSQTINQLWYI